MVRSKILIIGGGFAGLNLLQRLDKKQFDITLIDKNNYHGFPPLFYQIASCGLDSGSISFPFRRELRKGRAHGTSYRIGEVKEIDTKRKVVVTQYETIAYDKLIIASGTTNNFFNLPELEKSVYTLKSASEALRIRDAVLQRLEIASLEQSAEARRKLLSFVVVGGGATGVEVAGALGDMRRYILPREYPSIPLEDVKITIVEGSGALLGAMSRNAGEKAERYLMQSGVNVVLGHTMKAYEGDNVFLEDGRVLHSSMVIWTAGVKAVTFNFSAAQPIVSKGGRLIVDEYNRLQNIDDVYAVGDICFMSTDDYPSGHPQLAQVAIQQSANLARNLNRQLHNPEKFRYRNKGTMATIGRNMAVADIRNIKLSGRIAWMTWMFVHLISILGMRNKLSVLINWIWSYFTYSTSLRQLIYHSKYPLRHLDSCARGKAPEA